MSVPAEEAPTETTIVVTNLSGDVNEINVWLIWVSSEDD